MQCFRPSGSVKDINITLAGYFCGEVMYKLLVKDVKLKYK